MTEQSVYFHLITGSLHREPESNQVEYALVSVPTWVSDWKIIFYTKLRIWRLRLWGVKESSNQSSFSTDQIQLDIAIPEELWEKALANQVFLTLTEALPSSVDSIYGELHYTYIPLRR